MGMISGFLSRIETFSEELEVQKKEILFIVDEMNYQVRRKLIWIRRMVWNRGLKMFWCGLWVRRDEFHPSLRVDPEAAITMSEKRLRKYYLDLNRRRLIAHHRDEGDTFGE